MTGEIFYWLFNMSIIASAMGVIVLLLRKIKAIPRRISVLLWIVPFFRMMVPVGLASPYSLMTLVSRFTTKTVIVLEPSDKLSFTVMNAIMLANNYDPIVYKVNILDGVFRGASLVWIVGAVAVLITLAVMYVSTKHEIKDAEHLRDNVYISDKVQGPAVYGIIKPRIVLPSSYADRELKYVVAHENAHIKRADNFWRALGFFIAALHWFNPLSWIFLKKYLSDLELACDEYALSKLDENERKEYASSLLDCAGSKSMFASAFGGAKIRTRIENIISYKKMTVLSAIGFTALVAAIICVMITNAS